MRAHLVQALGLISSSLLQHSWRGKSAQSSLPKQSVRHALALVIFFLAVVAAAGPTSRTTISLDGSWQIGQGRMDQVPERFDHAVPVPGLVSLAQPPFVEPGPVVGDRNSIAQKDPRRDAFWYRRTFKISSNVPAVATLKIGKAMFGARVFLNGKLIGDHLPCFTPALFDVQSTLRPAENELVIRVGADRDAVGNALPNGFDYEKTRYIPGIFDSVELILSGTPHVVGLQVAPDLNAASVRLQTRIANAGPEAASALKFVVREAKSGRVVSEQSTSEISLSQGADQTVSVLIPMPGCHAWSPEDPFLYTITAETSADRCEARFGMRSFEFDPNSKLARLNGKPYFLRGSNITLYRFFEDSQSGALPWDPNWVRLLHRRIKEMHWNCLRYCIGFPPEAWYRIADEEGILLQDEFPLWYGGTGWSKWPQALKSEELAVEYAEWMRERWNHPSVVIWDASNETASRETGLAVQRVRGLDLSHRPWDNSYGTPRVPGDVFESHPYHFQNPKYKLADLAKEDPVPQGNELRNPGDSPVVINEYGWLWLNRDGTPTTLTKDLYANLLGANSTTAQRRHLYARYLAAETEFWRSHRQAAAVMHFTALGYSRPTGQTSDHWLDVAKLQWEPEFYRYVRDAFAPVGVMIDDWLETYAPGKSHDFSIVVLNDEARDWKGKLRFKLSKTGHVLQELKFKTAVPAFGRVTLKAPMPIPAQSGTYQVQAVLEAPGGDVHSLRDFAVAPLAVSSARP